MMASMRGQCSNIQDLCVPIYELWQYSASDVIYRFSFFRFPWLLLGYTRLFGGLFHCLISTSSHTGAFGIYLLIMFCHYYLPSALFLLFPLGR